MSSFTLFSAQGESLNESLQIESLRESPDLVLQITHNRFLDGSVDGNAPDEHYWFNALRPGALLMGFSSSNIAGNTQIFRVLKQNELPGFCDHSRYVLVLEVADQQNQAQSPVNSKLKEPILFSVENLRYDHLNSILLDEFKQDRLGSASTDPARAQDNEPLEDLGNMYPADHHGSNEANLTLQDQQSRLRQLAADLTAFEKAAAQAKQEQPSWSAEKAMHDILGMSEADIEQTLRGQFPHTKLVDDLSDALDKQQEPAPAKTAGAGPATDPLALVSERDFHLSLELSDNAGTTAFLSDPHYIHQLTCLDNGAQLELILTLPAPTNPPLTRSMDGVRNLLLTHIAGNKRERLSVKGGALLVAGIEAVPAQAYRVARLDLAPLKRTTEAFWVDPAPLYVYLTLVRTASGFSGSGQKPMAAAPPKSGKGVLGALAETARKGSLGQLGDEQIPLSGPYQVKWPNVR
jgi:hypothetical protein